MLGEVAVTAEETVGVTGPAKDRGPWLVWLVRKNGGMGLASRIGGLNSKHGDFDRT